MANVDRAQFLIGQRVLVKFIKPGRKAPPPAMVKTPAAAEAGSDTH